MAAASKALDTIREDLEVLTLQYKGQAAELLKLVNLRDEKN